MGPNIPISPTAVEMRDPATQLTLVIEGTADPEFCVRLIPELLSRPLKEIAAAARTFARRLRSFTPGIWNPSSCFGSALRLEKGVVVFDVADKQGGGVPTNSFLYYLFPSCHLLRPACQFFERADQDWPSAATPGAPSTKIANLASICERYGGGGHAKVAAISLPPTELARARVVAAEIAQELRASVEPGK